ncbi:PREDICTED: tumor protein p63-regulated gene 1-like protein [Cyprinodon variegatus]|uniref:tumor protein p63-regulated gene 1-like protein n=1 Tax=Cyprinodon variegatus TaxID=28743 RepID=UPI00074281AD|nr:PREDICTED: tumor protein p63-regulated gene 1-like protein [Cyprinodon variegatus]
MANEGEGVPVEKEQKPVSASSSGAGSCQQADGGVKDSGEQRTEAGEDRFQLGSLSVDNCLQQFKIRKFFVLRPGTLNQAIKDVEALVKKEEDGNVHGVWLMAEVDHWNNEKERLVIITDKTLLIFKYDFVLLCCEQIQRIQLNFIDRISHGTFSFPKHSLLKRDGEGVRVFWDRLREPSFTSRWNPFANDFPFSTFTYHPVRNINDTFAALCDIQVFSEKLKAAAERAHAKNPVPGKANGVLVLQQPIYIEAYVGAMAFLGNQNKLGYCMARGNLGF